MAQALAPNNDEQDFSFFLYLFDYTNTHLQVAVHESLRPGLSPPPPGSQGPNDHTINRRFGSESTIIPTYPKPPWHAEAAAAPPGEDKGSRPANLELLEVCNFFNVFFLYFTNVLRVFTNYKY